MEAVTREDALKIEEIKAIKLFIFLFYFVFIGFDLFYYYMYPFFMNVKVGLPDTGLGFFVYLFLLLLFPMALYLIKNGNPFYIKYVYFFGYLFIEVINNILIYWDKDIQYTSGNIVEILFLVFAPIFVNKKFFWIISWAMTLKYIAYGVLFQSMNVLFPVILIIFLSIFGYILLSRFISYINGMMKMYEESKQTEKLAVVGQMAASIAHEIKNPLSALKGFTQLQQEKDQSSESYYPIMLNEIDRINLIVSDLLILGKPSKTVRSYSSVKDILDYVITVIEPQASRLSIRISSQIEEGLPDVLCADNQLKQVFINLLKNSVESMPNGGNINITAAFKDHKFIISVKDEGSGIPQEKIDRLGEPFFTTKEHGTGLGLLVTKRIIEEHGGELVIRDTSNKGTIIDVILADGNN